MKDYAELRNTAFLGGLLPQTSRFVKDEFIDDTPSPNKVLFSMQLPALEFRRVYCSIEAKLTTGTPDFAVECELEFRKGGTVRAVLPVNIGRDDNPNYLQQSLVSFFPNPQPAGQNAINLVFSKDFGGGTIAAGSLMLTPYELRVAADEVILRVKSCAEKGTATVPKIRAWLGVLSMS